MLHAAPVDRENLVARLAVLREGLLDNSNDSLLIDTLYDIKTEVAGLVFHKKYGVFRELNEDTVAAISAFLDTMSIVLDSILKADRYSSFRVQRALFDLYYYMFHHPQFEERFDNVLGFGNSNTSFPITTHIYDIAERQNILPSGSGNLYAEGEWLARLTYRYGKDRQFNPRGLEAALVLWKNLVFIASARYPSRLVRLYENMRETCLNDQISEWSGAAWQPPPWYQIWLDKYIALEPSLYNFSEKLVAIRVLQGEPATGDWKTLSQKAASCPVDLIESIEEEDLQKQCIEYEGRRALSYLYGCLAYNERWLELEKIWYNFQPLETNVHHIGNDLLRRSPASFHKFVVQAYSWEGYLGDRIQSGPYFTQATVFLFHLMFEKERLESFSLPCSSIAECDRSIKWLASARTQLSILENGGVMTQLQLDKKSARKHRKKLKKLMNADLLRVEEKLEANLATFKPNPSRYGIDHDNLREMWSLTNSHFTKQLAKYDYIDWEPTRLIGRLVESKFVMDESFRYTQRSGRFIHNSDFGGHNLAFRLVCDVASQLISRAQSTAYTSTPGTLWLLPKVDYEHHNDEKENYIFEKTGLTFLTEDRIFWCTEEANIVAVLPESFSLRLHQWSDVFYEPIKTKEVTPVVYGNLEFGEKLEAWLCVHYELVLHNPKGLIVLS